MYIIPLAWLYVALMMAVAEATNDNGTVLGGLVTFLLYGLGPVLLVLYLMGSPARRKAIRAGEAALAASQAAGAMSQSAMPPTLQSEAVRAESAQSASADPALAQAGSAQPDAGSHAPAAAQNEGVAPVRKEP